MTAPNDHVADRVDDYVHDLLSPADAERTERHCDACPACQAALLEARRRLQLLESVPPNEPSAGLIQSALARVEDYERRRRLFRKRYLWGVTLGAAAAVLAVGCLHVYYLNLAPTPADVQVLGQAQLFAGAPGSLRVCLVERPKGTALAGVPVVIELRNRGSGEAVQLARFTTNAEGTGQPRFRLPDWPDGDCELRVTARVKGGPEESVQTVRLKRSAKLMLTTDKPVYQPGQEVHVRALALQKPDLRPAAGQPLTFAIADPKGNVVFKQQEKTSEFGIAAADCPLATEILEGTYTITARVGDTESKLAVEVMKYVLPKFKIDVQLDRPFYQPGETARGTVRASYFFGKPVARGKVAVEVRTADAQPRVLNKLDRDTDEAGQAEFQFTLPESLVGRAQDAGDARITLEVTLRDTAEQKQTASVSRLVTNRPLRVEVIPEGGPLVKGVPNTIYLFASDPEGRPAANLRLDVSNVNAQVVTNELGVASFEVTPETQSLQLTVSADGKPVTRPVVLVPNSASNDFLLRTDRAVYDGGDTVHLVALGGGPEPVFVDFIKDDQTILTESVTMTGGRGTVDLDLPPEAFGTLRLVAYRLNAAGQSVRKTRVVYVRPARQVHVATTLDRDEYRPGREAKIDFRVTDNKGQPVRGALSLAAVDEAVFSVPAQAPTERAFYTLEQQLLQPVYAIYAWSPDVAERLPGAERNRFEQALFARTAKAGVSAAPTESRRRGRYSSALEPAFSSGEHTLAAASYSAKSREVEKKQQAGLDFVRWLWVCMGIGLTLVASVWMWMFQRPLVLVGWIHFWCLAFACLISAILGYGWMHSGAAKLERKAAFMAPSSGEYEDAAVGVRSDRDKAADGKERSGIGDPPPGGRDDGTLPRVRSWFPETLHWQPQLITDDQGRASLTLPLADSITQWRLTASAVAADGRLGAAQAPVKVFQPFFVDLNLPVALTRGDEVAVPVVVHNYEKGPQTVRLTLAAAPWFTPLEGLDESVTLQPGEVRSTSFRLRVEKVGRHKLRVDARGGRGVDDAIERDIDVVPDGRRVEVVHNRTVQNSAEVRLAVPDDAIEGSAKAVLKVYPSGFSQVVEGLDAIFRLPYGCFEQTSSTTYPNVLALDYLRHTKKGVPAVEAKARQYIHLGYQRLLGFEVSGGGFDWFGRPPGKLTLTAYGLLEFQDMAKVHPVDPKLIERTRAWLLKQRDADGRWSPDDHAILHEDPLRGGRASEVRRLSTTAYVAWAVFAGRAADAEPTRHYLLAHRPGDIDDPYVLALVANALLAIDPAGDDAGPYLERLDFLKRRTDDGRRAWWEQPQGSRTTFYGAGRGGGIETTALATLALLRARAHAGTAAAALAWLVEQKDPAGTWYSTQATVLTLKALVAAADAPLGGDRERRIRVALGRDFTREIIIKPDQAEVMQQLDLSEHLRPGEQTLTLSTAGELPITCQVAFRYHVPGETVLDKKEPLTIQLAYDRTDLAVEDVVKVKVSVVNNQGQEAPMVMLDLPLPAGFALEAGDLARLVPETIDKYQVQARGVLVYLRGLKAGQKLELTYRLRATMPVKVSVPPARAYEYYDVDKQAQSAPARLTVAPGS